MAERRFWVSVGHFVTEGQSFETEGSERTEKLQAEERNVLSKFSDFERKALMRSWKGWSSRSLGERAEDTASSVSEPLGLVLACLSSVLTSECACHYHMPCLHAKRKFCFLRIIMRFSAAVFRKVQYRAVSNIMKTNGCIIFSHQFEWNQVSDRFWTCTSLAERKICSK